MRQIWAHPIFACISRQALRGCPWWCPVPGSQQEHLHCQAQFQGQLSGTQRLCGVLHTAGMWPWMDARDLGRTGGEEPGVLCFASLTNAVPQYQTGDRPAESFWVRITARNNLGDVVVDEDCRLGGGRGWSLQLGALVLVPTLSPHVGISSTWLSAGGAALGRQPRMFLECNCSIFLAQEQGSHDWLVHAGLAFCWGAGKKWGWKGSQSTAQAVGGLSQAAAVVGWQM